MNITAVIAQELNIREAQVEAVISLLDEGNTIPFIARYRKEKHGALNDEILRSLEERLTYLRNLDARREAILSAIEEQGKLTEKLRRQIDAAETLVALEDLYRPYKQKKRTRGMIAREKGLEPLAKFLLDTYTKCDPEAEASKYIDPEKGIETAKDALHLAESKPRKMRCISRRIFSRRRFPITRSTGLSFEGRPTRTASWYARRRTRKRSRSTRIITTTAKRFARSPATACSRSTVRRRKKSSV